MSLAKATRKLKRRGKNAVQFRITSTFEFIEMECKGTWRPDKLRVVWFRNHRKVKSNDTTLVVSDDFGPNGAKGRAVFSPAISVSLVVTLYRDATQTDFEEKEYKYYVEHDGPGGKKILATFNCNVSEFVGIPSTKQALDLNFKCVSKKVKVVNLGITLESQFMKEGGALDDDMQSTFSAMSAGQESTAYDEEDEDEEEEEEQIALTTAATSTTPVPEGSRLSVLEEELEESEDDPLKSVVLGTGQHLKRFTVPQSAPPKPPRIAGEFDNISTSDDATSGPSNPTTPNPSNSLEPTTPNPSSSPKPTTPNPSSSPKPTTPDPGSNPKPTTPNPSSSPKPTTPDPGSNPKPTTPNPSSSPKPTTPDPGSNPKPTTPDPSSSPKPTTLDPGNSLVGRAVPEMSSAGQKEAITTTKRGVAAGKTAKAEDKKNGAVQVEKVVKAGAKQEGAVQKGAKQEEKGGKQEDKGGKQEEKGAKQEEKGGKQEGAVQKGAKQEEKGGKQEDKGGKQEEKGGKQEGAVQKGTKQEGKGGKQEGAVQKGTKQEGKGGKQEGAVQKGTKQEGKGGKQEEKGGKQEGAVQKGAKQEEKGGKQEGAVQKGAKQEEKGGKQEGAVQKGAKQEEKGGKQEDKGGRQEGAVQKGAKQEEASSRTEEEEEAEIERKKVARRISAQRAKSFTRDIVKPKGTKEVAAGVSKEGAKVVENDGAKHDKITSSKEQTLQNGVHENAASVREEEEREVASKLKLNGVVASDGNGNGMESRNGMGSWASDGEPKTARRVEADGQAESRVDASGRENHGSGHDDHPFEMAKPFVSVSKVNGVKKSSKPAEDPVQYSERRITIESKEVLPSITIEEEEEEEKATPTKPMPIDEWLDRSVVLVDCFSEVVEREKVEQTDLIGLYFSAGWCPPCRRFLPKLVKFYHHLKQHGKSLEIIYISSDYTQLDMMKYMKEQQMPWVAISYEGTTSEDFRKKYNVAAVPLLKILTRSGEVVEESAKKSVESASNGSAILKLYNKWHEKLTGEEVMEDNSRVSAANQSKKGLLSKVKATIHSGGSKKDSDSELLSAESDSTNPESGRRIVDNRSIRKTRGSKSVSQELLDEKDERIHHLEEVNRTLKQTNDELSEELGELRQKLDIVTAELEQTKSTSKTLQDESRELIANLNMRGWLYKRGVRGITAAVWRRRYFRLDQGSKLYYYKNSSEGNPQGFIDIDKVIGVQEVTAPQQDKNHATFTVQCDGRIFQLQAHDEASMRKWIEAIAYMTNWRKKHSTAISDEL